MPAWTNSGDLMERAMRWAKTLTVVGAHAEGEVGRVVTGGVLDVPGATMRDKLRFLNEQGDDLRKFCMFEPRGCAQMTANLLLPPVTEGAAAAFIPMQADRSHAMSGSNAMCVIVVLLETGILAMREPETVVVLDTAAGTVESRAACADLGSFQVSASTSTIRWRCLVWGRSWSMWRLGASITSSSTRIPLGS